MNEPSLEIHVGECPLYQKHLRLASVLPRITFEVCKMTVIENLLGIGPRILLQQQYSYILHFTLTLKDHQYLPEDIHSNLDR